MRFHARLVTATLLTGAAWAAGSLRLPLANTILLSVGLEEIQLLRNAYVVQVTAGILQGAAFAFPLWWASRAVRWQHALAIFVGVYLASTYWLTMPTWALNVMARPVISQFGSGNFPGQSIAASGGFVAVPQVRPFLTGLVVGFVLQRACKSFRWKHALTIAAGLALIEIVLGALLKPLTELLFQNSSLLGSQIFQRRIFILKVLSSGFLYVVLARTNWEGSEDAADRANLGVELMALARPNVLTNHLTDNRYVLMLVAMLGLLASAVIGTRYFLSRRPTPEIILPSLALIVLPSILVSIITARLVLARTRDSTWELLVLTNLSRRDIVYAFVQTGLYHARWLLVIIIVMMTILSYGVMRVFTGLFYSLSPLTLPRPLIWEAALVGLPIFMIGTIWMGAALGMRLALHLRSFQAVLLAPAAMLAITLIATLLAQNYQQNSVSIISEAVLFSVVPWLAVSEMMRSVTTARSA